MEARRVAFLARKVSAYGAVSVGTEVIHPERFTCYVLLWQQI